MSSRAPGDNIYSLGSVIMISDMDICQHTELLYQSHHHHFDFPAREPNLVLSDKALDTHMTTVWVCSVFV